MVHILPFALAIAALLSSVDAASRSQAQKQLLQEGKGNRHPSSDWKLKSYEPDTLVRRAPLPAGRGAGHGRPPLSPSPAGSRQSPGDASAGYAHSDRSHSPFSEVESSGGSNLKSVSPSTPRTGAVPGHHPVGDPGSSNRLVGVPHPVPRERPRPNRFDQHLRQLGEPNPFDEYPRPVEGLNPFYTPPTRYQVRRPGAAGLPPPLPMGPHINLPASGIGAPQQQIVPPLFHGQHALPRGAVYVNPRQTYGALDALNAEQLGGVPSQQHVPIFQGQQQLPDVHWVPHQPVPQHHLIPQQHLPPNNPLASQSGSDRSGFER
jgi:hypothetical protein